MKLDFTKFQATGNDFIMLDNRKGKINPDKKTIALLCDRRKGIGADGLIMLSLNTEFDFTMHYYNSDGGLGTMCGNGGRAITAFAQQLKIISKKTTFEAYDGKHCAELLSFKDNVYNIKLQMQDVKNIIKTKNTFIIDTGSPHLVVFTENVDKLNVFSEGAKLRYSKAFAEKGINVDFVEIFKQHILVRTYERGVEAETLSCGTGVVASAIAAFTAKYVSNTDIKVKTLGGELKVKFKNNANCYSDIWLSGEVVSVFKGTINI
ncbi:MAG: diaminopimelate epimerase [Bacteroidales bacterium]|nr:diaminopimelate epimerase [Bacteroidales bacterium]